ncbi:hypothetical protein XocVXO32_21380, partial [Xanthomonas oryzae pv. oryzicola]|uniref:hypothetical protein n=1 Tax=Xanthomonas oryzae TaxID=347 RepID=UPI003CF64C1C
MKTILLLTCLLFFLNGPALAHNNERVINAKCNLSYLVAPEKPSQTPNAMFGGHMMLEHVE